MSVIGRIVEDSQEKARNARREVFKTSSMSRNMAIADLCDVVDMLACVLSALERRINGEDVAEVEQSLMERVR